jgi:DNA-directed RNA polymerase subunit RPC12/RpoP
MKPSKDPFEKYLKRVKKESFEKYLERLRKEVGDQTEPTEILDCPFCGGIPVLKKETLTHIVPPHIWEGVFWVYQCSQCSKRFTTTQSDTISIATLKVSHK